MDRRRLADGSVPQQLSECRVAGAIAVIERNAEVLPRTAFGFAGWLTFVGVDGERLFTNDIAAGFDRLHDVAVMGPVDRGTITLFTVDLEHGGNPPARQHARSACPSSLENPPEFGDGPGHLVRLTSHRPTSALRQRKWSPERTCTWWTGIPCRRAREVYVVSSWHST